jgi:hypothetical protein
MIYAQGSDRLCSNKVMIMCSGEWIVVLRGVDSCAQERAIYAQERAIYAQERAISAQERAICALWLKCIGCDQGSDDMCSRKGDMCSVVEVHRL